MPEGDTVFLAATRLRRALKDKVVTRSDLRVPAHATADLSGRRILDIAPRGKHLLWRFEEEVTLHTHFKMEGSWHLYRPRERWRAPDHQVRAVIETADVLAVGINLGIVSLIPTSKEDDAVGHLGPDPLGADWDASEVVRRMASEPDRPIGEAILDQRVIAGPGNIYKSEVCFLRGIDPSTPVGEVHDLEPLVALLHRLLNANRTTGQQITTGDTRPGWTHWVYGRVGQPCRRCRTPIRKEEQGPPNLERVTYWCPRCQPRGGVTAGG
ncbi:MAG TPA: DNA-formamidopyrimidine glycosylase family protein [Actinomycetota bacterium]|nr:DNA-formamidopyrimidine glycosylase family protein [Actinomycetota bacterium]